jgi:hypothetical protein
MGVVLSWVWTIVAACAGVLMLARPGQVLTFILLLLSAAAACPLTISFLEKKLVTRLGSGAQLALMLIFAALAGVSIAQNPSVISAWIPKPAPIVPKTLAEEGGDFGNKTSKTFTPQGAAWTLEWSFDCSSLGDSGNFTVKVVRANGDVLASVEKIGDRDSGTEHYREAGSFHLQIVSECRWQVRAAG